MVVTRTAVRRTVSRTLPPKRAGLWAKAVDDTSMAALEILKDSLLKLAPSSPPGLSLLPFATSPPLSALSVACDSHVPFVSRTGTYTTATYGTSTIDVHDNQLVLDHCHARTLQYAC